MFFGGVTWNSRGSVQAYSGTTSVITEYDATIPAGKVGVWAGSGSAAVKADNFKVRDLAGFYTVDGRFVDDSGNVRVTGGKLEFYNSDGVTRRAVLDAVRMGKGVTQVDLTFRTGIDAGVILHYQDPENVMVALLDDNGGTVSPQLVRFQDRKKAAVAASGSRCHAALVRPVAEAYTSRRRNRGDRHEQLRWSIRGGESRGVSGETAGAGRRARPARHPGRNAAGAGPPD